MYTVFAAANWCETIGPGYMAIMLKAIHADRNFALHLREIKFLLPQDSLVASGVVEWFNDIRADGDDCK